jgi:hypothetical protein
MMLSAAFFVALAGATALAVAWGGPRLRRTGFAMLGNWAACMVAVAVSDSLTPWALFLLFDAATAVAVLRHPASRPQAIIGAIYLFQIAFHVAFALVGNGLAASVYLDLLALGGWLQIGTLLGGAIYGGGRTLLVADHFRAGVRSPGASDRGRMGAPR